MLIRVILSSYNAQNGYIYDQKADLTGYTGRKKDNMTSFELVSVVIIGIIIWNVCAYVRHTVELKNELEVTGKWTKKFMKELMKMMPKYMADLQKTLEDMDL